MASSLWIPPVHLFKAGRGTASSRRYYNDARKGPGPRRLLIKRTVSGTGVLYVRNRRVPVPEGMAFAIERPGPYIYCFEDAPVPWRFEYITISIDVKGSLLPERMREDPLLDIEAQPELLRQFKDLVKLRLARDYMPGLLDSALGYRFFLSYVAAKTKLQSFAATERVEKFKRLLERHFSKEISIRAMAARAGYAQETLIRLFQKHYGISPGRYVMRLRIRHACRLLEAGEMPLKRIAVESGFSSANYFGRAFRRLTGRTPGQYRANPDPLAGDLV